MIACECPIRIGISQCTLLVFTAILSDHPLSGGIHTQLCQKTPGPQFSRLTTKARAVKTLRQKGGMTMQGTSSFKRAITCWHRSSTPGLLYFGTFFICCAHTVLPPGSLLLSKDRASQCCNSILPSYPYSKPIPGPSRIYSHSRNYSTSHAPTTDKQR